MRDSPNVARQLTLTLPTSEVAPCLPTPPTTRYQGSKLKLLPWLSLHLSRFDCSTVLDAFGGTASVSYLLKTRGHEVTYNDYLRCNWHIARAILADPPEQHLCLPLASVVSRRNGVQYASFIADTFEDVYFTDAENHWLDIVVQNIGRMPPGYEQSLAYYALFQSCIAKRPYNLFHRKNLYMRTAEVERRFGNKATWDTPFPVHFDAFLRQARDAAFLGRTPCSIVCDDARNVPGDYALVYVDPPYLNGKGVGVDYFAFYHFLEGCTDYEAWPARLDRTKKHLPLRAQRSPWSDPRYTRTAFGELFERHRHATIVVSYRSDGIPSCDELAALLRQFKSRVDVHRYGGYQYVLSTNRRSEELLLIGH